MALLDAYAHAQALRETDAAARTPPRDCRCADANVPNLSELMSALFPPVYQVRRSHAAAAARPNRSPADAALAGNTASPAMIAGLIGWPPLTAGSRPHRASAPHPWTSLVAGRDPLIVFDGRCVLCSTEPRIRASF